MDYPKKNINKTVVFWGTYDKGKPRVRILISGLKLQGMNVIEYHTDIWSKIEDKSQVKGFANQLRKIVSIIKSYPYLIYQYLRAPKHKAVIVGYMGQFDILIIWLFAKLRKVPIIWDIFISLYDTVVIDRQLIKKKSIFAIILYMIEWLGVRAATKTFMDTKTHAEYIEDLYGLNHGEINHVLVGTELDKFKKPIEKIKKNRNFTVLFYGQFIPLHGLDTIVNAAKILEDSGEQLSWILIGKGQEQPRIDALIAKLKIKSIKRISWIPYEKLVKQIYQADVCLGIFNSMGKATRVIPNKVFQILATGKPLITGDTPAIRELLKNEQGVHLIQPNNPELLAKTILNIKKNYNKTTDPKVKKNYYSIGSKEIGEQFILRIWL